MTDDMITEHLARAHLAESVTMDAETWTEVLQEVQRYRQAIKPPLTDEEIWSLWVQETTPERRTREFVTAFARAIEAAHGIKGKA